MADPFLVSLFEHKAWCDRELAGALAAAPATADRREMAIAILTFEHTSIVDRIFKARLLGEDHGFASVVGARVPKLDELAATMAQTDAWYVDYARAAQPAELAREVVFTFLDGDPGRMTKGEILAHVITHGASHRGAVGKMLERLEVPGAPDMVTSFVSRGRPAATP